MTATRPDLRRWRGAALLTLLGGCAHPMATTPYVAPAIETPSARLVMRGTVPAGESYEIAVFADAPGCRVRQRVGVGRKDEDPKTTRLGVEHWQTLEVMVAKPQNRFCAIRWSFVPHAGRSYVVLASSTADGCASAVRDVTDPDHPLAVAGLLRRNVGRDACLPLAQSPLATPVIARAGDGAEDLPIGVAPPAPESAPTRTAPKANPGNVGDSDLQGLISR